MPPRHRREQTGAHVDGDMTKLEIEALATQAAEEYKRLWRFIREHEQRLDTLTTRAFHLTFWERVRWVVLGR